ncbi:hypothetical protein BU24DRAFT_371260 [Aaosphaeria arxii CBS 175.79]|uniref:Major facilitator superfamily (MFS) profile domain-containing protein n=1 Tax=Aaosphaeria arxii CBS 175.79 TaxID=1450172 RepID=A0A6A5XMR9_9PLEO|nr:uncharacterized protein BU24DRAFT_371260 [Aaosphaeria arxii CBS 175.79]KAF2014555.1 hypothetical protein BU24DRAFT_371260 [Aaosphaeria arxii CBS 175.79]
MQYQENGVAGRHGRPVYDDADRPDRRLAQPFVGWTPERMNNSVDVFLKESELEDYADYIRRGAFLAQSNSARNKISLKESEARYLDLENSTNRIDKFKQPWRLYALVGCCSLGAAVQGWDETAVNGAQVFYKEALGLDGKEGLLGLVNGAPYLCCAFACWLNYPMNKWFDRRGVIFITCLISSLTCLGQAFPQRWEHLFVARFLLGFGIGPKSATIPIYAAEAAPANIRGALVMMWQMWTAFGIMCGYIAGVALADVRDGMNKEICGEGSKILLSSRCSLNWRLMLASPMILPLVVVAYVYTLPESPRWLLKKARAGNKKKYEEAFMALCKLRHTKLQAGRDLFLINYLLQGEEEIMQQQKPFSEMFSLGRNRRALTASFILMILQQLCGVNVVAYYSSTILKDHANYSDIDSLIISMGFGIINFLFAIPAIWTIDTFGRRNLLLSTFPFMGIFQIVVVIAFALPDKSSAQHILVILGMYLFGVAYSPGEGPVPFVYSAESMPLYNRDFGMGLVTSVNWLFNWMVSMTWPKMSSAFTVSGAFGWYAAWCFIGWWTILFFVPETKDLTLEDLDQVFGYRTREHMRHGIDQLTWFIGRFIFGRKNLRKPVFLRKPDPDEEFDNRGETYIELHEDRITRPRVHTTLGH